MKATRRVLDARDSTPTIRTNLPYPGSPVQGVAELLLQPRDCGEHGIVVVASFFRFSEAFPPQVFIVPFEQRAHHVVGSEDLHFVCFVWLAREVPVQGFGFLH